MRRPRFLQGGLLGGLLSRAAEGDVAVAEKPVPASKPDHVAISLSTLAQTIEPVINTAKLNRESRHAVADGFYHVAELVAQHGKNPVNAEYTRLHLALAGIGAAIKETPSESIIIQVPIDMLRTLRYTRHNLASIAEKLETTPIERATSTSANVTAFSRTAPARDYANITVEGRDAAVLRIASDSINHHFDTMFALDATTGLDQLTRAF
jgi:hypothetical protein